MSNFMEGSTYTARVAVLLAHARHDNAQTAGALQTKLRVCGRTALGQITSGRRLKIQKRFWTFELPVRQSKFEAIGW